VHLRIDLGPSQPHLSIGLCP